MKTLWILVVGLLALTAQIGCHNGGTQGCAGGQCGLPPANVYQQSTSGYGATAAPLTGGSQYAAPPSGGGYQGSGSR